MTLIFSWVFLTFKKHKQAALLELCKLVEKVPVNKRFSAGWILEDFKHVG